MSLADDVKAAIGKLKPELETQAPLDRWKLHTELDWSEDEGRKVRVTASANGGEPIEIVPWRRVGEEVV